MNQPSKKKSGGKPKARQSNEALTEATHDSVVKEEKETKDPPENPHQNRSAMEVHHHPHLHHLKKGVREYLIEFSLIFLAITLGFYAEQIREHITERHKEAAYMRSLYRDLRSDSISIEESLRAKHVLMEKFDSLQKILLLPDLKPYNEQIYYLERWLILSYKFNTHDLTYNQMLSSGNLRIISNPELYSAIAGYYKTIYLFIPIEPKLSIIDRGEIIDLEARMFNPMQLCSLSGNKPADFYHLIKRPSGKLDPIHAEPHDLKLLYLKIDQAIVSTASAVFFLQEIKKQLAEIMTQLRLAYEVG
ncbi:MAG: hypothetical protein LWW85_15340 [Marinilabiliales bacterium]|nr:hypothetical protein [Marinilabiliales bacterium]